MALTLQPRPFWRSPSVRFPVEFVVLLFLMVFAGERLLAIGPTMVGITTAFVDWTTSGIGLAASRGGEGVMTFANGEFSYRVVPACTTTVPSFLFMAAVVAFPASWRQRGLGLAVGIPALFAFNIARLVILAWVGVHSNGVFDLLHWFGFQVFFVFAVGAVWVAWIVLVVQRDPQAWASQLLRPSRVSMPVFGTVLVGLGALGASSVVQGLYSRLLNLPLMVAEGLWDEKVFHAVARSELLIYYATFATVTALFLATQLPLRTRLSKLGEGLMVLFTLQALDLLVGIRIDLWQAYGGGRGFADVLYGAWEATHLVFLGVLPCLHWLLMTRSIRDPDEVVSRPSM